MKKFVLMKFDTNSFTWDIVEEFDKRPSEQDVYHYASNSVDVEYRVFENVAGYISALKLDKIT